MISLSNRRIHYLKAATRFNASILVSEILAQAIFDLWDIRLSRVFQPLSAQLDILQI